MNSRCKILVLLLSFVSFFSLSFLCSCGKSASKKATDERSQIKKKIEAKNKFSSILEDVKSKKSKRQAKVNGAGVKDSKLRAVPAEMPTQKVSPEELDFTVANHTGKTVYVACFSYIKKRTFAPWRWDKSNVCRLDDNQSTMIDIDTVQDSETRENVYAYLAVFDNQQDAVDATYELLSDNNKLDLDRLVDLKNRVVNITVSKYGQKGEYLDFSLQDRLEKIKEGKYPELDFAVENRTGKSILVCCFIYQKKAKSKWLKNLDELDDMQVWRFTKTKIIKIPNEEQGIIDVDTLVEPRDRSNARGILAVFDEDEMKEAEEATYELLDRKRKVNIGFALSGMKGKKIVLDVEKYGFENDFIDFVVKPVKKIDFKKVYEKK